MPRSKSSSASDGVMPKPAAAFSQLAMTRSGACCRRSSGKRSLTIVRPGRPKMSPMNRIFTISSQKIDVITLKTDGWLLSADLRCLQKIVIARGIQRYVPHTACVHQHIVEVPQVYRGNILCQDFLHCSIQPLADSLIGLADR